MGEPSLKVSVEEMESLIGSCKKKNLQMLYCFYFQFSVFSGVWARLKRRSDFFSQCLTDLNMTGVLRPGSALC